MIFNLYSRVAVKVVGDSGPESYVFDRSRLMFTEVAEIEKVTGLSYGEWSTELGRYSIKAVGALLHVLRKREGVPSDFAAMQFNAATLDVIPLHDDGTEFTPDEVAADLKKRLGDGEPEPDPTAGGEPAVMVPAENPRATNGTSHSSPSGSASARGNGTGSRGRSSAAAKHGSTPS